MEGRGRLAGLGPFPALALTGGLPQGARETPPGAALESGLSWVPPAASNGRGGRVVAVAVGRTRCYNISYLQLAHLPQVFGAAFLPSYLPD